MKFIIHTERTFKDKVEWEDYLDYCRRNGVFYPTVIKDLKKLGRATLRTHHGNEDVVTTYTLEDNHGAA